MRSASHVSGKLGWLFGSTVRLGRVDAGMLSPHRGRHLSRLSRSRRQIEQIRAWGAADMIQVQGRTDFFGHSYFVSNPEVNADIITMLRYGLWPNEPGRP